MRVCLDENQIAEFLGGKMTPKQFRRCEDHIDRCSTCRVVLAELAYTSALQDRTLVDDGAATTLPGEAWYEELLAERFRLMRIAGRGGMGVVYEAEDTVLGVRVAVKMLPTEFTSSPTYLRHLHSEIRIGRRIAHRNVCRIYDLGTSGALHFITMEYVDGDTLAELLARGRVPLARALEILVQVLDALEAAHEVGVVHRDLKPGNIMIDESGQVKVMDFGLAKDLSAEPSVRYGPIGTPAYWAPEQSRGESASTQTDIYSFGLIAYEVLADRYAGEMERRTLTGLRGKMKGVVARCLHPTPGQRYDTIGDLRADIRDLADPGGRRPSLQATMAAVVTATMLAVGAFAISDFSKTARAGAADARRDVAAVPQAAVSPAAEPTPTPGAVEVPRSAPIARPLVERDVTPDDTVVAVATDPHDAGQRRKRDDVDVDRETRRARKQKAAATRADDVAGGRAEPAPAAAPVRGETAANQPDRSETDAGSSAARVASGLTVAETRRKQHKLAIADLPGYADAQRNAKRALAIGDYAAATAFADHMQTIVGGVEIDATFVRRKLERIKRLADDDSISPETSQEIKRLFERVHRAYFDENYTAANSYLAAIGNLVSQERGP